MILLIEITPAIIFVTPFLRIGFSMNLFLQPRGQAQRQKKGGIAECGRIFRLG
jgi:hypothetical protein